MSWKKITVIFIVLILVIIGVYDVLVISKAGVEASISHTMIEWSYRFPAFTFLFGFVMGHLFWRMRDTKETAKVSQDLSKE